MAVGRADILDVTYLGRFTGIPNGALTGGRVDPSFRTRIERRRVRRVVSAIHRIVRLVIGQMKSSVGAIVQWAWNAHRHVKDSCLTLMGLGTVRVSVACDCGRTRFSQRFRRHR